MKKGMKYLLLVAMLFCYCISFSQNRKIDSLLTLLKTDKEDTNKVNHLNNLGWQLKHNNPDTAIILSNQALTIAEKCSWKKGMANALSNLGVYNYLKAEYPKALDYYFKALSMVEKLRDKSAIAALLGNLGTVYRNQADYPKALDYYFKALKLAEEIGTDGLQDKNGIATKLGNIGNVYYAQTDYPKALDYYFKALKMAEELGDKNGIERHLSNIGNVYADQANYTKASPPERNQSLARALDYYSMALKMAEELTDKKGIAINHCNIGNLYIATKKYSQAETYLLEALKLVKEIGAVGHEKNVEYSLSELYLKTNRYELAFTHYKKFIIARDSIANDENAKKQTRTEMNFEFEKKEAETKAEQEKKDLRASEEKTKQKLFLWFTIAGLGIVLVVAVFIFRSLQLNKKKNKIITEQKEMVEKQKEIVEEKQKEILDSIYYARRIQRALITNEKYIERKLNYLKRKN
ncbi:MAG: tetratricopeptide repeat protein [Bacteroidia bacterium]|nr:tetratricopeptide repeat protein [Bacteroidia bacterium]